MFTSRCGTSRSLPRLAVGAVALTTAYAAFRPTLHADSQPTASSSAHPYDSIPPRKPGVFLDENGKPCKACTSFSSFMKTGPPKRPAAAASAGPGTTSAGSSAALAGAGSLAVRSDEELQQLRQSCPPDIEELGRSTWTFLHALSVSLPSTSPLPVETQTHVSSILIALPHLYPCPHCRADLATAVAASGGDAAIREACRTRAGVEKWLCERHNEVNIKLGKDVFDCSKVRERWRDGPKDGRCDLVW